MKNYLKFLAMAGLSASLAHAGTITVGGIPAVPTLPDGQKSAQPGVCTIDFNTGTTANLCGATYSSTAIGVTALMANTIPSGTLSGAWVAPVTDTTNYLAVSTNPGSDSSVYVTLATTANYFGFYTGSLDSFNDVRFYKGGFAATNLVDSFNGTAINLAAFGALPTGNFVQSAYVNYFTVGNVLFDRVIFASAGFAIETDNHSFAIASTPSAVPEPTSCFLLAVGAVGLIAASRRKPLT
jgi:hypothetical protein